jgi:hypothetical protein
MLLRNVGLYMDYTALYPRGWQQTQTQTQTQFVLAYRPVAVQSISP